MAATIRDVANLAGVSTSTVSRVINDDSRISDETKKRVLGCIRQLDYRVNNIARSLKTKQTRTIGFIAPEIANDFFMQVARGVETELKSLGYSVIICNSNESEKEEEERIRLLWDKRVDGIIVIPATGKGNHLRLLTTLAIPAILVDRLPMGFVADAVLVNNLEGSKRAVLMLFENGARRIGFIGGDMTLSSARERYEGYISAYREFGLEPETSLVRFGDFHVASGYSLMRELMELPEPPQHVFISNYFMSIGGSRYLIENRNSLPEGFMLATFDDMEMTPLFGIPRITVAQPIREIGREAALLLIKRIKGDDTPFPQIIRLETEVRKYD